MVSPSFEENHRFLDFTSNLLLKVGTHKLCPQTRVQKHGRIIYNNSYPKWTAHHLLRLGLSTLNVIPAISWWIKTKHRSFYFHHECKKAIVFLQTIAFYLRLTNLALSLGIQDPRIQTRVQNAGRTMLNIRHYKLDDLHLLRLGLDALNVIYYIEGVQAYSWEGVVDTD